MSLRFYEFGPYRIDANRRRLWRDGETVSLTPKSFDLLLTLIECRGEIISKDELMQRVWRDSFVEDGNLTYNISVLRKALGERAGEHQYILTVPGRGYRFIAAVNEASPAEIAAAVPNGAAAACATDSDQANQTTTQRPAHRGRYRFGYVAVALAVAALVLVGGIWLFRRSEQPAINTGAPKPINAVAVLPLVNGSGDPEMEYLSDGISESLINSLSQLPGLKVIARSSSFKYKGKEIDPQEVARALGVEAILTGRIAQRGENLLINVELMDARDKTQVWGERYDRRATDLQVVQSEISREIVAKLRLKLTNAEQQQLAKRESTNPQAYELLLKGRFYWNKRGTKNEKAALDYFNQAIAVDPAYAPAYADLSFRYTDLAAASVLDPKEFMPKAEAAAHKAIDLDESLAESHLALAKIESFNWEWAAAEREFKRAIELNPNLARARSLYAFYLSLMGQHEQALAEGKRARELDPLSPVINAYVGYRLLLARQYDQAIEAAKRTLELDQNLPISHLLFGYIYAARGQYTEAIAAYRQAIKLGEHSPDTQVYLGVAYAKAGERAQARVILKQLEASKAYVSPGVLVALYVALGESEQAFAALERAYAAHDLQLQFLRVDPNFDPLRSDPRFQDLLRRVGLAQKD